MDKVCWKCTDEHFGGPRCKIHNPEISAAYYNGVLHLVVDYTEETATITPIGGEWVEMPFSLRPVTTVKKSEVEVVT